MDYAFIKNGNIINIALFDNPSNELLELFKNDFDCDEIILDPDKKAVLGGTWDGTDFILPKPYPSWILNSDKDWEAPVAMPVYEEGKYPEYVDEENFPTFVDSFFQWNEDSLSWEKRVYSVAE